jgi:hypothetical protein
VRAALTDAVRRENFPIDFPDQVLGFMRGLAKNKLRA